jgi:hypothetical protein
MYRENLEALRQRVRELDRALAALPQPATPPRTPFPWKRLRIMASCLAIGLLFLAAGIDRIVDASQQRERVRAHYAAVTRPLHRPTAAPAPALLFARVTSGGAGDCTIAIGGPCHATIACNGGQILYRGSGTCAGDRYVDPADSWLDGTPQCAIDLQQKRALVREIEPHRYWRDHYATRWQVELELQ